MADGCVTLSALGPCYYKSELLSNSIRPPLYLGTDKEENYASNNRVRYIFWVSYERYEDSFILDRMRKINHLSQGNPSEINWNVEKPIRTR
jgi:hypothetical protein